MAEKFKGKGNVISIAFFDFMRMMGIFMVLPVFTLYGYKFTSDTVLIGVAFGSYGLAMSFMQTPLGILSDRIGRKKIIVGGMIPYIAGNFIAFHPFNIYILIFARLLTGMGAIGSASTAFVEESVSGNRMNIAMAFIGVSAGLAFMAGMIMGPILAVGSGLPYIFLLSGILGMAALVPIMFVRENPEPETKGRKRTGGKIGRIGVEAGIVSFIFSFYMMVFFFFIPLYSLEIGGLRNYSTLFILPVIIGGIVAASVSVDADRSSRTSFYALIALLISVISVPFVFIFSMENVLPDSLFIGLTLFFISYSIYEIVFAPLISKLAGKSNYGANIGINNSLRSLGQFFGAVFAGFFIDISLNTINIMHTAYILMAMLVFSLLFYILRIYRVNIHQKI